MEAGEYSRALELAKTVEAAKLKSAADLSVIAEAYYKNSEYETALVYFEQIYQRTQTRRILINLINLCLKLSMADMAESYLRDFEEMAPKDFYCHIFRYRIDKLRGESLDVLIYDLELLKEDNYMEDWAYELAKLYHKNGQTDQCIAECDDIILWFGSGTYVERARGLRAVNLSGRPEAGLTDTDVELVQEVRRLVDSGRTAEEVENFIEESTMPEGKAGNYSEEEYRSERYGKPVYEEEGRDVIWYTKEFGPITEEMIRQQNTMDMLQGMQVAQQIKMRLGEDREMQVEELQGTGGEHFPKAAEEESEGIQREEGKYFDMLSVEKTVRGEPKAEEVPEYPRTNAAERAGFDAAAEDLTDDRNAGEDRTGQEQIRFQPARKSIWERHREEKERKKKEQEAARLKRQREKEEENARLNREVEESLYRMLQEEEQAAELSRTVQSLTGNQEHAAAQRTELAETEKPQTEPETAQRDDERAAEAAERQDEAKMAEAAERQDEGKKAEAAERQDEAKTAEASQSGEGTAAETMIPQEAAQTDDGTAAEAAAPVENEVMIFQYPEMLLPIAFTEESGRFYRSLKEHGTRPEDFFAGFMVSEEFRKKLLDCMEQIFNPRNKNIAVVITGGAKSGKTILAKAVAKCLQVLGLMTSPRVAVIHGGKLNRIRLAEKKAQLKDTTLIIEAASEMKPDKISELLSMTEDFAGTTAVILEDEKSRISRLFLENKDLNNTFKNQLDLPEWTMDDWFLQGLAMLAAKEFLMKESVAEQFLENVKEQIAEHPEDTFEAVHNYTGRVIRSAEKRMAAELKNLVLKGRYQEADLMLLKMEDL